MVINQEALLTCLQIAKDLNVPKDQAKRLIECGYIPYPWQWKFHSVAREADVTGGPIDIGLGGARGPGKSHAVLSQAALDDCQRIPKLKGLFLRQTGIAAQESFDDLVEKVVVGHVAHKKSGPVLKFPNGSRILLGGFQDEKDIDKYIGIEYDFIIVEELNQLTEDKYTKLRGSLRTSKPNWRPRMYTSFNPGGIGHQFVKERYVLPHRESREKDVKFVPSTYLENPNLNREYIDYLESLTGDLGKAWREGDFDLFAGQFFKVFRYTTHVVSPFIPYKESVIVGGLDWGRVDNFSFHLAEVERIDTEGTHFFRSKIFCEIYGTEKTVPEWVEKIKEKLRFYNLKLSDIAWIRADTQIFNKNIDASVLDIYTQFVNCDERFRTLLRPANKDRIGGWENLQNWFSIAPDGKPYLQITADCTNAIRVIPSLIHDEHKVEDVDQKGENDAADSIRYLHMSLKWIDGKVGAASQGKNARAEQKIFFADINDQGRQIPVDFSKFKK